jgi:hypothetical protein
MRPSLRSAVNPSTGPAAANRVQITVQLVDAATNK